MNVVVEIPTGTTAKWEVRKEDGFLAWEQKSGKPRVVQYLGYPGNYGMVPRTLSGDGDPLDVIVLGPPVQRGAVVPAKLLGVLKFVDRGEEDDKLLAVLADDPLSRAKDIKDLEKGEFVNVATIVSLWFESYKGAGVMMSKGMGDSVEARARLEAAIAAYTQDRKHRP